MTDELLVEVDQEVCMGMAYCVRTASQLFEQDDAGVVQLTDPEHRVGPVPVPDELRAAALTAANLCPSVAILLTEGELS